ncbi:MAG TPA: FAD-dependent oxidoreductase [Bryobacteraceae bacterium]|nr:FAD-dependent oxidoreductase [Bryobacteraceae bacterium]
MSTYDVAVVGAGTFGAWTAFWLARAGKSVLLLDAWGSGQVRSSSGGESRVIRMGYGADEIYTRMAQRSLTLWQDLFQQTGQPLFHKTGVLWMARDGAKAGQDTCITLRSAGVPFEILTAAGLAKRYPQMRVSDPDLFGILEPDSGAILARRAVATVVEASIRLGVKFAISAVQPDPGKIPAKTIVFACGAWLPKLFPDLLGSRIFPTRQEELFFAPPAGDCTFAPPHLPVWIDFVHPLGPYGIPDVEARGFKLAFDRHGPAFDPDSGDRAVGPASIAEARSFLAHRFPALRDAPLTESRVCQYENTSNGDFLIDRHPDFENVWLVGGGSGHGFKHGPAVGEYACRRVLGGDATEPRFSIQSKKSVQQRTVF